MSASVRQSPSSPLFSGSAKPGNLGIAPESPGQFISRHILEMGFDQKTFAKELNVSAPLLTMLIQGQRRLSSAVIAELERVTGRSDNEWHEIQRVYEEWRKLHGQPRAKATPVAVVGGILSQSDILRLHEAGNPVIEPFDRDNLGPASMDLSLGNSMRFPRHEPTANADTVSRALASSAEAPGTHQQIVIHPGDTWKIWTKEKVSMPNHLCGRMAARSELIMEGIFAGFGLQLDPGWAGHPFLLLTHHGSEPFELDFGQPCVSLEFRVLSSPWYPE